MRASLLVERVLRGADVAVRGPGVRRAAGDLLVAEVPRGRAAVLRGLLELLGCCVVETRGLFQAFGHAGTLEPQAEPRRSDGQRSRGRGLSRPARGSARKPSTSGSLAIGPSWF